jgi:hypothetical protein
MKQNRIAKLIASGDIVECAACEELSAYSFDNVTPRGHYFRGCWDKGEIAHVGACSSFEWECGHCGANNVDADAPILAECYTHTEVAFA